jgi:hypothetical protein
MEYIGFSFIKILNKSQLMDHNQIFTAVKRVLEKNH